MNRRNAPAATSTPVILLTDAEAAMRYGIGKTLLRQISDEAGAVVRIGRCRRIDIRKLDDYFGLSV